MKTSLSAVSTSPAVFALRHELRPGDLGSIVYLHGTICARESGFDSSFETDVAGSLAEFVRSRTDRDRIWIAEHGDRIAGCVALVGLSPMDARIRWFLVDPSVRSLGLDWQLLHEAIEFGQRLGYECLFLQTIREPAMTRILRSVGFERVEEKLRERWGVEVVEERYILHPSHRTGKS